MVGKLVAENCAAKFVKLGREKLVWKSAMIQLTELTG